MTRLDDRFVVLSDRQAAILASLAMKTLRQRYEVNRDPVVGEIIDDLAIVGNAFLDRRADATKNAAHADDVPSSRPMETTATAAKRLGITPSAVRRALDEGRLVGEKIEGRWRVDPTSTYKPAPRRPAKGFDATVLLGGIRAAIAADPELQADIDATLEALASSGERFALAVEMDAARGFSSPTPGTHADDSPVVPGESEASVPSHGSEARS